MSGPLLPRQMRFTWNTVTTYLTLGLAERAVTLGHLPLLTGGFACDPDGGSTRVSIATQLAQAGE